MSDKRIITLDLAQNAIMQAVDLYPDRVVQRCTYVLEGEPNCIVGVALDVLGLPLPEEGTDLNENGVNSLADWLQAEDITLDGDVVGLWSDAQCYQDLGEVWSDVRERLINNGRL